MNWNLDIDFDYSNLIKKLSSSSRTSVKSKDDSLYFATIR